MQRIIKYLTAGLSGLISLNVAAATTTPPFTMRVGSEIYQELYQERSDGQLFMQEKATMIGLTFDGHYAFTPAHALRLSGRIARGESTYTGSYQGGNYGDLVSKGQDRSTFDLRALYENSTEWEYGPVTGAIGLGYRDLVDRLDQSGPGGYKRENELLYLHLSEQFELAINSTWKFSPAVGINILLYGRQHSDDLLNTQDSGLGAELSAPFERALSGNKTLRLQPFFRYWQIGDSNHVDIGNGYYAVEPSNSTKEYGVNISVGF